MKDGLAMELCYMDENEYYLVVVNKVKSHGSTDFFYTVNSVRAFSTNHKDVLDFTNEYLAMLELELSENDLIEDLIINPFVYFGEKINPRKLPEEHPYVDTYLLFFPDASGIADDTVFQMFECGGVEDLAYQIESELQIRAGMSIERVIVFRCADVELVQQISSDFDMLEFQREFIGE